MSSLVLLLLLLLLLQDTVVALLLEGAHRPPSKATAQGAECSDGCASSTRAFGSAGAWPSQFGFCPTQLHPLPLSISTSSAEHSVDLSPMWQAPSRRARSTYLKTDDDDIDDAANVTCVASWEPSFVLRAALRALAVVSPSSSAHIGWHGIAHDMAVQLLIEGRIETLLNEPAVAMTLAKELRAVLTCQRHTVGGPIATPTHAHLHVDGSTRATATNTSSDNIYIDQDQNLRNTYYHTIPMSLHHVRRDTISAFQRQDHFHSNLVSDAGTPDKRHLLNTGGIHVHVSGDRVQGTPFSNRFLSERPVQKITRNSGKMLQRRLSAESDTNNDVSECSPQSDDGPGNKDCMCDGGYAVNANRTACIKTAMTKHGCTCVATSPIVPGTMHGQPPRNDGCGRLFVSGMLDLPWCYTTNPSCASNGPLGSPERNIWGLGIDYCGTATCPPHSDPQTCKCNTGYRAESTVGKTCVPVSPTTLHDGAMVLATFVVSRPASRPAWVALHGWENGSDPCTWDGIYCEGMCPIVGPPGRVCSLQLNPSNRGPTIGASLRYTLSSAIGQLADLVFIDLANTQLHGTLPMQALGKLTALVGLYLYSTQLSGTLPATVGNLFSLRYLKVSGTSLSGTVPAATGNLTALSALWLMDTSVSGTLSATVFGQLTSLQSAYLYVMPLSGTLPATMGNMVAMQDLRLQSTLLSGTLPPALGNMTSLFQLDLASTLLSGTLPAAMGNLASSLQHINLNSMPLSGTLPTEVGNLTALRDLYMYSTLLSGTLPDLRGCGELLDIDLHGCALSSFPPALPRQLQTLYLYNNPINSSAKELGALLYNSVPNLIRIAVGFSRATVLLAPDYQNYPESYGTRVSKPTNCTVGGTFCAFRLDLSDDGNHPVLFGNAVRGLTLGLGNLRTPMHDLGNGSLLASINMSWIDHKGARLFRFYDEKGREFQPIGGNRLAGGSNCSNIGEIVGQDNSLGVGGCPKLRTVNFGPRLCVAGSHTVADAATGTSCVCAADFPVPYSAGNTSSPLTCHVPCPRGSVPSHNGDSCICTGSNYNSDLFGTLVCVSGEFRSALIAARGVGCLPCPDECATCKDGLVTLRAGWRLNSTSPAQLKWLVEHGRHGQEQFVLRCPADNLHSVACPAIVLNSMSLPDLTCLDHHAGILCAMCETGYSLRASDNSCVACGDNDQIGEHVGISVGWFVLLLVVLVVVVVAAVISQRRRLLKMKEELLTPIKILLGLLQVLSMLRVVLNVVFPPNTQQALSFVAMLAIDTRSLFQFNCVFGWYERWLLVVLGMPVVAIGLIGLCWVWQRQKDKAMARQRAIDRLFFAILLLYPQVSQQVFSALRCRRLGASLTVLEIDYGINCDSDKYGRIIILAVFLVVLVPLGIPLGLGCLLRSEWRVSCAQWELGVDEDAMNAQPDAGRGETGLTQFHRLRIKDTYGFCTDQFRPECWYWEPVDMLRKLFLTGLLQLVDRGSAFQVMMGCSVSFIFASLQHRVQPYVKPEANTLKSLVEGQIFLTFLISFIIRTQNINVERFGPEFFGAVLVVSLGMVILAAAVLVAKQVHHKRSFEARLLEGIEFETVTATGGSGTMTELPSIITAHESVDTSQRP